jgi:hypothetical protein
MPGVTDPLLPFRHEDVRRLSSSCDGLRVHVSPPRPRARGPYALSRCGARPSEGSATLPRMRRWTSTLVVVVSVCLGTAAGQASAVDTRLKVAEKCSFSLLPDDGVLLTTTFTVTNARRGRPASLRLVAGWNIDRLYLKAPTPTVLRLGPGGSVQRVVKRTLQHAPALWKSLRDDARFTCASTKTYTIG